MAKKQFIRHLEFYGFPDQNKYTGFEDIDLSGNRHRNTNSEEATNENRRTLGGRC